MNAPSESSLPPLSGNETAGRPLGRRIPIRWRWTLLVGLVVLLTVVSLFAMILDMERKAWLDSQQKNAIQLVDRLGDDLKIPMLSASRAEVDFIVHGLLDRVPDVVSVNVHYVAGSDQRFGEIAAPAPAAIAVTEAMLLDDAASWYGKKVIYSGVEVGSISVRFSQQAWKELANRLLQRMALAALVTVLLAGFLVYRIAVRISRPLELLAGATRQVAVGDLSVQLPPAGNDEIGDAIAQFNGMVKELAHKEQMRDVLGRYLNPKLVSDVFDGSTQSVVEQEGRRQEVTILFADMVAFTSFSESTETEEVIEVLNSHFEVFHAIISYFGGHVDKYIGDAVMAVFNHPREEPEHARRAAMAAIAMTMACPRLGILRESGEPVSFRVGINSGPAIVGNIGAAERLEYTVIGDAVNVASRVSGLGEGGEVILSEFCFDLLGPGFAFESIGPCKIKGVSKPLVCGKVTASSSDVHDQLMRAIALAFDFTLPSEIRVRLAHEDQTRG